MHFFVKSSCINLWELKYLQKHFQYVLTCAYFSFTFWVRGKNVNEFTAHWIPFVGNTFRNTFDEYIEVLRIMHGRRSFNCISVTWQYIWPLDLLTYSMTHLTKAWMWLKSISPFSFQSVRPIVGVGRLCKERGIWWKDVRSCTYLPWMNECL